MTISDALTIGGVFVALVGVLLRHVVTDARRAQRLKSLENRVKKLDGIDANGD